MRHVHQEPDWKRRSRSRARASSSSRAGRLRRVAVRADGGDAPNPRGVRPLRKALPRAAQKRPVDFFTLWSISRRAVRQKRARAAARQRVRRRHAGATSTPATSSSVGRGTGWSVLTGELMQNADTVCRATCSQKCSVTGRGSSAAVRRTPGVQRGIREALRHECAREEASGDRDGDLRDQHMRDNEGGEHPRPSSLKSRTILRVREPVLRLLRLRS